MSKEQKSLYDKLGGRQSIELMVADFYQSMLNDDDLNTFYIENVSEISDLHYTQTHFMVMLVGGPNFYKGRNMYQAHKSMPIFQRHFHKFWYHLQRTFIKHKVSKEVIEEVKELVYAFQEEIVNQR